MLETTTNDTQKKPKNKPYKNWLGCFSAQRIHIDSPPSTPTKSSSDAFRTESVYEENTIDALRKKAIPLQRGKHALHSIETSHYLLELVKKTFYYFDKKKASSSQDQAEYYQIRSLIEDISLENTFETIETKLALLNTISIRGEKSLLLTQFFVEYLNVLSQAFRQKSKNKSTPFFCSFCKVDPVSVFDNAKLNLQDKINDSEFYNPVYPTLEEVLDMIDKRERRENKIPEGRFQADMEKLNKLLLSMRIEKNRESIQKNAIENALEILKNAAFDCIRVMIESPHMYLPIQHNSRENEFTDIIEDSLFSNYPAEYLLITHYFPENAEILHKHFAFSDSRVIEYFNEPAEGNKQMLLNIIQNEHELSYCGTEHQFAF